MEPRFQRHKEQLLAGCQVPPTLFRGVMGRLEDFAVPFAASLPSPESRSHTRTYLAGLLSDVERKNAESIAYRHDLDRQTIQRFVGEVDWDHDPLIGELSRQVAGAIGRPDAVLVIDPSAFAKKGTASVGVQRQWCGRLGKVDNCQVGVFLGYVSDTEHALVDFRLYLPRGWAGDRKRRRKAGVPRDVQYRTRHELALEMLGRRGGTLPHGWVAGDDEMGRPAWFRRRLAHDGERYLLAVPANTTVRALEEPPPEYGGHGRRPKAPFRGVRAWCEALPAAAWTKLAVRDGARARWRWRSSPGRWSRGSSGMSSVSRRCWWWSGPLTAACSSMITTSPTPPATHRWRSSPGWPRRSTGSRSACSGPRARRGWGRTRCGTGVGGTTTSRYH